MRISACQMTSGWDAEQNVLRALNLIAASAESGAELVVLPEHFAQLHCDEFPLLSIAENFEDGPIQESIRLAAIRHQLWICAGSIPIRSSDPSRFYNSTIVYNPKGDVAARYDRMHLFRYRRGSDESYDESRAVVPGKHPISFRLTTWDGLDVHIGLSLGFDLRFPELFRCYAPVDMILLPAVFTETTGRAHWSTLLSARAIENECYVVAAAQTGQHECGRRTWGHSRVVDPWGNIASELPTGEGIVIADFDETLVSSVRRMLPVLENRVLR